MNLSKGKLKRIIKLVINFVIAPIVLSYSASVMYVSFLKKDESILNNAINLKRRGMGIPRLVMRVLVIIRI